MEKIRTDYKVWGALAYIIFFLPLLVGGVGKDSFVRFHVRQGLGLLIASFALKFITIILILPLFVLIGFLSALIPIALNIFILALLIMGIINASKGEKKLLPVIGVWADKHLKI
ncbi:hypothetical protein KKH05_00440 [Patescibacteria group bacterium]|nr:hypothetical protein [Patescibacteria group bacterium]